MDARFTTDMTTSTTEPQPRWFHPTPTRFVTALLAVEVLLWLSDRLGWPARHGGFAMFECMAIVGIAVGTMVLWFIGALVLRWQFQFGVRTLLLVTVSIAIACSWATVVLHEVAEHVLTGVLQDLAEMSIKARDECAEDALQKGKACFEKGDYNGAVSKYTEAISFDPKSAVAYYGRGQAYLEKAEHCEAVTDSVERALADYTDVIRLSPKDAVAYYNRGVVYQSQGERDKTIADCTEAIRLTPAFANAYRTRGIAYRLKSEFDKAIADCTEAIRLNPKDTVAYYNRGVSYRDKGDCDKAVADLTEAIQLDPDDAIAYFGRAKSYEAKGDKAKAEADFEQARKRGYNAR